MTAALFKRPGWWRALTYTILAGAFGLALVVVLRKISGTAGLPDGADRLPAGDRARDHRAARLPGRHRLLRLLAPLGGGCPDLPGRARAR